MKLDILLLLFLCCFISIYSSKPKRKPGQYGQHDINFNNAAMGSTAIESAKRNGCIPINVQNIDTEQKIVSSCFAGGFVIDVLVHGCEIDPCNDDERVKFAKVIFRCNEEPASVKCLNSDL